jgi:hypothetical protein
MKMNNFEFYAEKLRLNGAQQDEIVIHDEGEAIEYATYRASPVYESF